MDISSAGDDSGHHQLTGRERAMLRAVAAGRAEMSGGSEPDLYIDGLGCCDQYSAHMLAHRGFIRPVAEGAIGERVPAELTDAGREVLADLVAVVPS